MWGYTNLKNLNIEFLEIEERENTYNIAINGDLILDKPTYCYFKEWLYVRDDESLKKLEPYTPTDVFNYVQTFEFNVESELGEYLVLRYSQSQPDHKVEVDGDDILAAEVYWIYAAHQFDLEEWKYPWSVREYLSALQDILSYEYPDFWLSCEVADYEDSGEAIYDLYNGIGISYKIAEDSGSIKEISNKATRVLSEINNKIFDILKPPFESNNIIERSIVFPPEYHQAGLGILNYFASYISERYPEQKAKVKIEQDGLTVRMTVESELGSKEVIERALHEYELIVSGSVDPRELIANELKIIELKSELRIAQARLESQRDLLGYQTSQINELHKLLHAGLNNHSPITIDFKPEINLENKLVVNNKVADAVSTLIELREMLHLNDAAQARIDSLESSLHDLEPITEPESLRRSSAMSKFKRFMEELEQKGSSLNVAITKVDSGFSVAKDLARKYNKLAEWCGMPTVPSLFLD